MSYKLIPTAPAKEEVSFEESTGNLIYTNPQGVDVTLIPKSINDTTEDNFDFESPISAKVFNDLISGFNNINGVKLSGVTINALEYNVQMAGILRDTTTLTPGDIDPNVSWNAIQVLFNYFRDKILNVSYKLDLECYCRNKFNILNSELPEYDQIRISVRYATTSALYTDSVIIDNWDGYTFVTNRGLVAQGENFRIIILKDKNYTYIYSIPKYWSTQLAITRIEFIKLNMTEQFDANKFPVLGDDYNYAIIVDDNNTALCLSI